MAADVAFAKADLSTPEPREPPPVASSNSIIRIGVLPPLEAEAGVARAKVIEPLAVVRTSWPSPLAPLVRLPPTMGCSTSAGLVLVFSSKYPPETSPDCRLKVPSMATPLGDGGVPCGAVPAKTNVYWPSGMVPVAAWMVSGRLVEAWWLAESVTAKVGLLPSALLGVPL